MKNGNALTEINNNYLLDRVRLIITMLFIVFLLLSSKIVFGYSYDSLNNASSACNYRANIYRDMYSSNAYNCVISGVHNENSYYHYGERYQIRECTSSGSCNYLNGYVYDYYILKTQYPFSNTIDEAKNSCGSMGSSIHSLYVNPFTTIDDCLNSNPYNAPYCGLQYVCSTDGTDYWLHWSAENYMPSTYFPANAPPSLNINSPKNHTSYVKGAAINLSASANDREDGSLSSSIKWYLDSDPNPFYTGATYTHPGIITVGSYTIKAQVIDSNNVTATVNRTINIIPHTIVLSNPVAIVDSPHETYKPVTLSVNTASIDNVNSGSLVQWRSNLHTELLGTGSSISVNLRPGTHTISATLSKHDDIKTTYITVDIIEDQPHMTISKPVSGRILDISEVIDFEATVLFRGVNSVNSSIAWVSDIDGLIGSGYAFNLVSMSEGKHEITATATATENGETDTQTIYLTIYDKEKNLGDQNDGQCFGGNPINLITGNKFLEETDFSTNTELPLYLKRSYNSSSSHTGLFGYGWSSNIEERVEHNAVTQQTKVVSETGAIQRFDLVNGLWVDESSSEGQLVQNPDNSWVYTLYDNTVKTFNPQGQILSVTKPNGLSINFAYVNGKLDTVSDEYGYSLVFNYNAQGFISKFTDPDNQIIEYTYNNNNLSSVIYPDKTPSLATDNSRKQYLYENADFVHAITGLIDEENIRYATWNYNLYGQANLSKHANDDEKFTIVWNANGTITTTNALGKQTIYNYDSIKGILKVTEVTGEPSVNCAASFQSTTYDPITGFADVKTDWRGNQIDYDHNEFGQITSATVIDTGAGWSLTPVNIRVTSTIDYNSQRKPWMIYKPGISVENLYTPKGRIDLVTKTDVTTHSVPYATAGQARVTDYIYSFHLGTDVIQYIDIDGPRADVNDTTRYEYNINGNLIKITNALNQTVEFRNHNSRGQPRQMIDENGLVTDYGYNPRGWIESVTVTSVKGIAVTGYTYYENGLIKSVTQSNGASLTYFYNAARQLDYIQNNLGEKQDFEPNDLNGEWLNVTYKTAGDVKRYQQSRLFDELGRQRTLSSNEGLDIAYTRDPNGNVTDISQNINFPGDSATRTEKNYYDAFNRIRRHEADANATTHYDYDLAGNLIQVRVSGTSDQITEYIYNGFGELIYENSPAMGATTIYRDEAGNLQSKVNNNSDETVNAYDELNRLISITYTGSNSENVGFTYDESINGVGRLTGITDGSGYQMLFYDDQGYLDRIDYNIGSAPYSIDYDFDKSGQLSNILYPTGRQVDYYRDGLGRVNQITAAANGQAALTLVQNINYEPFGPIASFDYGNGLSRTVNFDTAYRPDTITHNWIFEEEIIDYSLDSADRIRAQDRSFINPQGTIQSDSKQFDYDLAHRLKASRWSKSNNINLTPAEYIEFDYDTVGNRSARREMSSGVSHDWNYVINSQNNQLDAIHKDALLINSFGYTNTGQQNADGISTFEYNRAERLASVRQNTQIIAEYLYNANGQRVSKQAAASTTHFHYDHKGQLLAETDDLGTLIREYVYLGSMPIAMMAGNKLYDNVESTSTELVGTDTSYIIAGRDVENSSLQLIAGDTEISGQLLNNTSNLGKEFVGFTIREEQDGASGASVDVYLSAVNSDTLNMLTIRSSSNVLVPIPMFGIRTEQELFEINITYSDGSTQHISLPITGEYIKLERVGSFINVYTSTNGLSWTLVRELNVPMLDDTYVGVIGSNATASVTSNFRVVNDNVFYLHADHLNSVYAVSSNSSKIRVWSRKDFEVGASPFGASELPSGESQFTGLFDMPLRFPGQYYDAETGLNYNYFRDYNPVTGRYLQSDPIGLSGGVNTYGYVGGNPLSYVDPLGLLTCSFVIRTGVLACINNSGEILVTNAVSGNGVHANNPDSTRINFSGPLPSGGYDINSPSQTRHPQHSDWMFLMPFPENDMSGTRDMNNDGIPDNRDAFFIHLFSTRSDGCIAVNDNENFSILGQWSEQDNGGVLYVYE